MAARSLNKVMLIGNLTRDPDLRYTPQGTPVCSFGIATNREWVDPSGQRQEDTEFHNVVAWNKLAEICSQLLYKGRKVYIEGRLSTRNWTGQDNVERRSTEVVIEEMIAFGPGKPGQGDEYAQGMGEMTETSSVETPSVESASTEEVVPEASNEDTKNTKKEEKDLAEEVADDIPF
jgi:single-strand DNA-binding protein